MTRSKNITLSAYLNSIRNPAKRAYAQAVVAYGPDSVKANQLRASLSYLAAQAVCMRVADIENSR